MRITVTSVHVDDQTAAPADLGGIMTGVFDDTCGNLVQLVQTRPRR